MIIDVLLLTEEDMDSPSEASDSSVVSFSEKKNGSKQIRYT